MNEPEKKILEGDAEEKYIDFQIENFSKEINPDCFSLDLKIKEIDFTIDAISHEEYKYQPNARKKLPVCRFWKTPWKNPEYTLILKEHDSNLEMLDFPSDTQIPTLIKLKKENKFFVYGLSEQDILQIAELKGNSHLIEQLNCFYTDQLYSVTISPVENEKIYQTITEQKLHIKKISLTPLKEYCMSTMASNIIQNGAKYPSSSLLPNEINHQIDKKIQDFRTGINFEKTLDNPLQLKR